MNRIRINKKGLLQRIFNGSSVKLVQFIKKDGSLRRMRFTTDLDKIPSNMHPKGGSKNKNNNPNIVRVFDVEKLGWRSIDLDKVQTLEDSDTTFVFDKTSKEK